MITFFYRTFHSIASMLGTDILSRNKLLLVCSATKVTNHIFEFALPALSSNLLPPPPPFP